MVKFNKNQELAVKHVNGPCMVLAGPGSGKTFVLTNRIKNLIFDEGIDPSYILVITFTRAAALEMKNRFLDLVKGEGGLFEIPTFGTFHSIFYDILKDDFGYNSESLIDNNEDRIIIYDVLAKFYKNNATESIVNNFITEVQNYKLAKEQNISYHPVNFKNGVFKKLYKEYDRKLFHSKKLSFSDMINKCYELLKDNKRVLRKYQDKYKYILIDEFQDINLSQYEIIKLICKSKNIFVVGDDDQSIYKFRGSKPSVLNDFKKDYRKAKIIYLTENYRCAKKIVQLSKKTIDFNIDRFTKNLQSNRDEIGNVEIKSFIDAKDEMEYVVNAINSYKRKGILCNDIAILYRTNILANSIKGYLSNHNISFEIKGGNNNVYDNFAIKDILSYLKLAIKANEPENLIRIINKPFRGISRDNISIKNFAVEDLLKNYKNNQVLLSNINRLICDISIIKKSIPALAIRYIRTNIGYDNYLNRFCKNKHIDYDEVSDLLDMFEEEAIRYKNISDFIKYIESSKDDNSVLTDNSVKLMTFHSSKGLEFEVVFIIDANDGLIPHKKSIKDDDIETERRLMYVAMTRAKNDLHIYFTTRRFGKNYKISRFLIEAVGGNNGKER